ncbi:MAG: glutamate 5-kinase [Clostridiales bacterium]|nr:glutamate 5-kinase [Clostridiales bacterium]
MTPHHFDNNRSELKKTKKLVIKVGTSSLTHATGKLNLQKIDSIVLQIANLHNKGIDVVLVSSGAIAAGLGKLGLDKRSISLPDKQAMAAIGQNILIHMYMKMFSEYGINIGQVLLTKEDFQSENRSKLCKDTFDSLSKYHVIPIVNENDAVAVEEIKVGDNDTLSALVANIVEADLLIILSDIDGLYDANPTHNPDAILLPYVDEMTPYIESLAQDTDNIMGTGGMSTKIEAVKIAKLSNTKTVIANGNVKNILNDILEGKSIGTYFNI